MELPRNIQRTLRTAHDFEFALPIVSYYMKIYVVEQLLAMDERTGAMTECASQLLDDIENFKQTAEDDGVKQLIEDQSKAKTYILNFALSLYNEQLLKIKEGKVDKDLPRALWCCVDLFSTIIDSWKNAELSLSEETQCQKRIKYCKVYLRKLVKGEIQSATSEVTNDSAKTKDEDIDDLVAKMRKLDESADSEYGEDENSLQPNDEAAPDSTLNHENAEVDPKEMAKFIQSLEVGYKSDNEEEANETEVQDLISKVQGTIANEPENISNSANSNTEDDQVSDSLILPSVPTFINYEEKDEDLPETPKFVDDEFDKERTASPKSTPIPHKKKHAVEYTKEDLTTMMNRGEQIAEVQKLARYAISALNYEDISTAKDELTKALDTLSRLE